MIKLFEDYPRCIYTGFLIRLFAFTIDIIMIGSLRRMTLFFMTKGMLYTLFSLAIYLLYFILMTKLNNGQTLGKMIFGIKVICLDEEELTWETVIVREGFGRYLQKAIPMLYAIVLFTPYKQHLVDVLGDTSVVTLELLELVEYDKVRDVQPTSDQLVTE